MKIKVKKRSHEEMRRSYPIAGRLLNWYFRSTETSNGAWLVEGSDVWGRQVRRSGGDPEELLAECVEYAKNIHAKE